MFSEVGENTGRRVSLSSDEVGGNLWVRGRWGASGDE